MLVIPFYIITKPFIKFLPDLSYINNSTEANTIIIIILSSIFLFSLSSALLSVLIYKFVSYITKNKKHQLIIPFLFAFGTLFFVYSTGFYPRVLSTFLIFLSFYLLFKYNKEKSKNNILLFISGFCGAFAIIIDFPQIITLGLLFLYFLSFNRSKKIFYFIIGASIPLIFLFIYNYSIYDTFIPSQYNYRAKVTDELSSATKYTMGIPSLSKAILYLFSLKFGLFIYMPIFLMSIFGFWYGFKDKKYSSEIILFLLISISQFLFYISFTGFSPCSFGLRYTISIIPFMIIPVVYTFNYNKLYKISIVLSLLSIIINFIGTSLYCGCIKENIIYYFKEFISHGLSNYTLFVVSNKFIYLTYLIKTVFVIIALIILTILIYLIWRKK